MNADWQTPTALSVVALTALVFLIRLLRPGRKRGCGGDCGCHKQPPKK